MDVSKFVVFIFFVMIFGVGFLIGWIVCATVDFIKQKKVAEEQNKKFNHNPPKREVEAELPPKKKVCEHHVMVYLKGGAQVGWFKSYVEGDKRFEKACESHPSTFSLLDFHKWYFGRESSKMYELTTTDDLKNTFTRYILRDNIESISYSRKIVEA